MTAAVEPLRFDAEAHRYYLGPRELVSVTAALKSAGLVDDRFYTEEARLRGQYVHTATQLLDEGDLDVESLDPVVAPYVAAYQQFLTLARPSWEHLEHRVYDDVHGYAGTLDRAGTVYGQRFLVDLKSGSVPPFVGPQTAAYRACLPEPYTWRRAALHLRDDGTFAFIELSERTDFAVFMAALTVAQWKARHGVGSHG